MKIIKNSIILLSSILLLFGYLQAQPQLPNSGFESWQTTIQGNVTYEEPSGDYWTTLNALAKLGSPVTVSKSSDAHSGSWSARLESKAWGSLLIPGLLVTGKFITEAPFVLQGQPFTAKPLRFKGYCKYFPVNNDSAAIYAMLSCFNPLENKRDTLAEARLALHGTITEWTLFSVDFLYFDNQSEPDSLDVVFSSSAAGESFQGQVGSTLFLDDVSLDYTSGLVEPLFPEYTLTVFPVPANDFLWVYSDYPAKASLLITDMNGKNLGQLIDLQNGKAVVPLPGLSMGNYILVLMSDQSIITRTRFTVLK